MVPAWMLGDDPEDKPDATPPPLDMLTALIQPGDGWVVVYHFYLGPLDGHFPFYLGDVSELSPREAKRRALASDSPMLAEARLALLRVLAMETKH